jgi:LPS O-antigen subunit length determinant protein (WzzB/FepE family)
MPSSSALKQALHRYVSQLEQRVASGKAKGAKDFVELDASLWTDLVARIQTRAKEDLGPHVTLEELKEVMRWKLAVSSSLPNPLVNCSS